jgi:hypothetical protein
MGLASVAKSVWEVHMEWESAHDGSVASSHAIAHGDVEFELEADPNSKLACWL